MDPIQFLWRLRHNTEYSLLFSLITGNSTSGDQFGETTSPTMLKSFTFLTYGGCARRLFRVAVRRKEIRMFSTALKFSRPLDAT
jgi:hypothetical protein